jgi:hypothetical protein
MAVTAANLIMGPGTLYAADFGTVEPADTAVGTAPADFEDVGGTQDGVTLTLAQEYTELEVDQIVDVPGRRLTKREFTLETNMAEPTLENLAVAMNAGDVTTGTGFKSLEPVEGNSATQPNYKALIFDGFAPGGFPRRVIVRKALSTDDVEFAYSKEDQTVFSVTFSAHYVSSSIKSFKIVDGTA